MSYKKSVIVTGAGGLIGKEICKCLYANNVDILAIYHTRPLTEPEWKFMVLDIEKEMDTRRPISAGFVIHCAANLPKPGTYEHLEEVAKKNEIIDTNILH